MSWLRFPRRKRADSELQDEIEAFLTEETADNEARGISPEEARRQARIKLGSPQKVRESLWVQSRRSIQSFPFRMCAPWIS
jgi:putative ABC transport system permease protein